MKKYILASAAAVSIAAVGCVGFEHKSSSTAPTTPTSGVQALMGSWQSVNSATGVIPSPSTCSDFKWNATEQTATTAKGYFSANCAGVAYAGTASGTLTGTVIAWGANGTATGAGLPQSPCAITLTGTAELGTDSIRVPYSGSTCAGNVSGVEILKRR